MEAISSYCWLFLSIMKLLCSTNMQLEVKSLKKSDIFLVKRRLASPLRYCTNFFIKPCGEISVKTQCHTALSVSAQRTPIQWPSRDGWNQYDKTFKGYSENWVTRWLQEVVKRSWIQRGITLKDTTSRMTKNDTRAEKWRQVGYLWNKPRTDSFPYIESITIESPKKKPRPWLNPCWRSSPQLKLNDRNEQEFRQTPAQEPEGYFFDS